MDEPTMDPEAMDDPSDRDDTAGADGETGLEELGDPEAARALEGTLAALEKETELLLFISPGCRVCPHQVRAAATVALASPKVVLEVVDATREPDLAERYEVGSVPTTVVDDELIMMGVVPAGELALRLVERQSTDAAARVFRALVEAGHVTEAAERLADGRALDHFLPLWQGSDGARRLVLMRVVEESLLYDPFGLGPLVAALADALDGDGPVATDTDHRADTAELLGKTGDDEAREPLERLADDPDPVVAKAAREALAALDE
jgi:HEAT repeat protein